MRIPAGLRCARANEETVHPLRRRGAAAFLVLAKMNSSIEKSTWRVAWMQGISGDALVELGFGGAGLGGDDGWGNNHSDKGEGDQEVMHWGGLLGCGVRLNSSTP